MGGEAGGEEQVGLAGRRGTHAGEIMCDFMTDIPALPRSLQHDAGRVPRAIFRVNCATFPLPLTQPRNNLEGASQWGNTVARLPGGGRLCDAAAAGRTTFRLRRGGGVGS